MNPANVSFDGFKAFVKSKINNTFNYCNAKDCAFAQYLKSLGYENPSVNPITYTLDYTKEETWNSQRRLGAIHPKLNDYIMDADGNYEKLDRILTAER